jgi:hypothetical protein
METQSVQGNLDADGTVEPTCRRCLADFQTIRIMMDPATGRSVRIFECDDCGQQTWDD